MTLGIQIANFKFRQQQMRAVCQIKVTHYIMEFLSCQHKFVVLPDAPIISPHQELVVVQINRQGTVPCGQQILSHPPASFTWTKLLNDGGGREQQFNIDQSSGNLLLNDADYSDSGTYMCTAENSIGTTYTKVMVLVLGKT